MNLRDHNRTEHTLRNAALAVSAAAGEDVFRELARSIATILDVEVAFIALPKPGDARTLKMLAYYVDGRFVEDFEYGIAGTPCETVVGRQFQVYPSALLERFPLDDEFRDMGVQSYAGYPLSDARGEPAGLMSVVSRRPIAEPELIESVLKIFAARVTVELERLRADEALRASEEQYRAIFNASEDALVLWDSSLRRVDINSAYERLYGWTREEVIGRGYETLGVPAQFTEPRLDLVRRTLAGETCRVELESVRRNGEHFQADIRTIPFMHRGERHVLTIARDITKRRQREEALRASEEQYRAIFNASFDGMIIRTLDGKIVDVNPALESMYGYARDELIGKTFGPIIPEDRAESFHGYLAEVAAGRHFRTESHVPRKDGSRVYIEVLGSPVMYHGKPHVLSVVRDITERRAQESRLRATVEAALDSIVIMDEQGLIREFNPAAERSFGHKRADVIGKSLAETLIPQRLRDAHRQGMLRYLASGEGPYLGRRVEVTALRADGSEFPAELAIATARGLRGRIFVGYLRDITGSKQAAARHASSRRSCARRRRWRRSATSPVASRTTSTTS